MKYTLTIEADTPAELEIALRGLQQAHNPVKDSSVTELSRNAKPLINNAAGQVSDINVALRPPKGSVSVEFPDWLEPDGVVLFGKWMAARAERKNPVKPGYQLNRLLGQLGRLRDAGNDPVAVIRQSIDKALDGFRPVV